MRWSRNLAALVTVALIAGRSHAQTSVSAQVSMVGRNSNVTDVSNKTNKNYSPFDATYARVFLDAAVTDRLAAFLQIYASATYGEISLHGAYVRYDHTPKVHLEAGLIPMPVGLWAPRTYPDQNPLIAVPAMYQYKTSLDSWEDIQKTADEILEDQGGSDYTPTTYDFCWNTGVHGYASAGPLDFGLALLSGSLGSPQRRMVQDQPNVAAHVNFVAGPALTVGVWGAIGPYLSPGFKDDLPSSRKITDYRQKTAGALMHLSSGHLDAYAEGILNRFEHPFLGNLDDCGGYADVKYSFALRWWAAARVDGLTFSRLKGEDANNQRWDHPLIRYEIGVGRWFSERALIKVATQIVLYAEAPRVLNEEIYAVQFTVKM